MNIMRRIIYLILLSQVLFPGIVLAQHAKQNQSFTMALTGDAIITRKLSVYNEPEFLEMIKLIRSSDVAFTNLEILFHNYESFPMHKSGGTYMRAAPALVKELTWAGFDMVSRANNHSGDYGVEGMRLTTKYVAEAGLVDAGVGESLLEAREARFLETAKGRVALISCASSFLDHSRAGKTRGDIPPRPGLNPLRFATTYYVPKAHMDSLREIGKSLGLWPPRNYANDKEKTGESLRLFGMQFKVGEEFGVETKPNEEDLAEIVSVIKNASRLADYTIVSIHAHERAGNNSVAAQFIGTFARAAIDAGADVITGNGPHVLRGIEIYKNRPIFYSLGDFMFQNETLLRLPYENYERYRLGNNEHVADFNDARYNNDKRGFPANPKIWESVIAVPEWQGKQLVEVKLYPITLGHGEARTVRGRPLFADDKLGKEIINDLIDLSKPFNTTIEYKDGIGIVKIPSGDKKK